MFESQIISEIFTALKKRGVLLRYITEINKENINFCKKMMEIVELRHLDNIKGGLIINELECMYMIRKNNDYDNRNDKRYSFEHNQSSPVLFFYSNSNSLPHHQQQQQLLFDMMWEKALPAGLKVKKIQEKKGSYQRHTDESNASTKMKRNLEAVKYAHDNNVHRDPSHNIANGLKNPLQSILGFSKLLLSNKGNIEEFTEYLEIIHNNSQTLSQRTDEIIQFLEIEENCFRLYREDFDLIKVIRNIISNMNFNNDRYPAKPICAIYSDPEEMGSLIINADVQKLQTVVKNLVMNAVEFSGGRDVEIHIFRNILAETPFREPGNNDIMVSVIDKGYGIDASIYPELFTKFVTTSTRGLGLGLYLSKNIVELHGGRIWAINNNDGVGSTFIFSLPEL